MEKSCLVCDKPFRTYPCHEKKGRGKYCSMECSQVPRRTGFLTATFDCEVCKKRVTVRTQRGWNPRFCSMRCVGRGRGGAHKRRRDGSKYVGTSGYVMVRVASGKARSEHSLKVEKALGRRLRRGEVIHHVDGDRANNANKNPLVCSRNYHSWLHSEMSYRYQRMTWGG